MLAMAIVTGVLGLSLVTGVCLARARLRAAPARLNQRFREAAEEARRLAHHALIVEAAMSELSELVIEQCLAEIGMGVAPEPV